MLIVIGNRAGKHYISQGWTNLMNSLEAQKALDTSEELQITVTGRRTGRQHSTLVWFVREGKTVFLLPVSGSGSQWYKNVVKSKKIKISTGKLSLDLSAKPITESQRIATVADKFREKHGASDVKKYYTGFDAAVELTLP
jgi:hypothetical protein